MNSVGEATKETWEQVLYMQVKSPPWIQNKAERCLNVCKDFKL